ncbi:MAG TPA: hypothetical protein VHZ55_24435 [Bryobacteraceae bacterium]|nr:hypothetical protein [Bryobacteraceae bacterium]
MSRGFLTLACLLAVSASAQNSGADSAVTSLPDVRRVYVSELTGTQADELRALLISSLAATKLFVLTDNEERADAILKGAADEHAFTDSHDIQEGLGIRENASKYSGGSGYGGRTGGSGGLSLTDSQSHHSKERKHEAYAALRLCNKDGDVIWSTTQESQGAKFRGASADVAAKVARQITLDMERSRREPVSDPATLK